MSMKVFSFAIDDAGDVMFMIGLGEAHVCVALDGDELDEVTSMISAVQLESKLKRS